MRTRKIQQSGKVYGPDQTIPLVDALKTFTINAAYLTYDERDRGSLTDGKLADLVIVGADLAGVPDEELLTMAGRVDLTMVGGAIMYQRDGFALRAGTQ
jgi:hypothetical protein